MSHKRKKRRRFWDRYWPILAALAGVLVMACVLLWAALAHVPDWYRPPQVTDAEYNDVKKALMDTVVGFTDALPAGQPFQITLTDAQINRWIAVRTDVWPGADEWIPDYVREPVVVFEPGGAVFGARFTSNGWEAILSARLTCDVGDDTITIQLDRLACGSCPLPISVVARRLRPVLTAADGDVDIMPDPMADAVRFFRQKGNAGLQTEGVTVENRLFWKPSERWFRIRSLSIEPGILRAEIEPLGSRQGQRNRVSRPASPGDSPPHPRPAASGAAPSRRSGA